MGKVEQVFSVKTRQKIFLQ